MLWDYSNQQMLAVFLFIVLVSFLCGWIADKIMDRTGFGVLGNCMLLALGCCVGLVVYNRFGYSFHWFPVLTIVVAAGSATVMLMTMAGLKAATNT